MITNSLCKVVTTTNSKYQDQTEHLGCVQNRSKTKHTFYSNVASERNFIHTSDPKRANIKIQNFGKLQDKSKLNFLLSSEDADV